MHSETGFGQIHTLKISDSFFVFDYKDEAVSFSGGVITCHAVSIAVGRSRTVGDSVQELSGTV
jgi:hypothetical protein